jgi:hypothetical protein
MAEQLTKIELDELTDRVFGMRFKGRDDTPEKERDTQRLRDYWAHGEGGVKIAWGTPGDFDRCVAHVAKYMDNPKGYCAERHHDALGIWPATHAKEIREASGTEKNAVPDLEKIGPHGFTHGWVFHGVPGSDEHAGSLDDLGKDIDKDYPSHGENVHAAANAMRQRHYAEAKTQLEYARAKQHSIAEENPHYWVNYSTAKQVIGDAKEHVKALDYHIKLTQGAIEHPPPLPDYAHIADLERTNFGETFSNPDAPAAADPGTFVRRQPMSALETYANSPDSPFFAAAAGELARRDTEAAAAQSSNSKPVSEMSDEELEAELSRRHAVASKFISPDLVKVGPHGFIHGWIYVGPGNIGDDVEHPQHGHGKIVGADKANKRIRVKYDNGREHKYVLREDHMDQGGLYRANADVEADNPGMAPLGRRAEAPAPAFAPNPPKRGVRFPLPARGPSQVVPPGKILDDLAFGVRGPRDLNDVELRVADNEFARRADLLGKPGEIGAMHQQVKNEIQRRFAEGVIPDSPVREWALANPPGTAEPNGANAAMHAGELVHQLRLNQMQPGQLNDDELHAVDQELARRAPLGPAMVRVRQDVKDEINGRVVGMIRAIRPVNQPEEGWDAAGKNAADFVQDDIRNGRLLTDGQLVAADEEFKKRAIAAGLGGKQDLNAAHNFVRIKIAQRKEHGVDMEAIRRQIINDKAQNAARKAPPADDPGVIAANRIDRFGGVAIANMNEAQLRAADKEYDRRAALAGGPFDRHQQMVKDALAERFGGPKPDAAGNILLKPVEPADGVEAANRAVQGGLRGIRAMDDRELAAAREEFRRQRAAGELGNAIGKPEARNRVLAEIRRRARNAELAAAAPAIPQAPQAPPVDPAVKAAAAKERDDAIAAARADAGERRKVANAAAIEAREKHRALRARRQELERQEQDAKDEREAAEQKARNIGGNQDPEYMDKVNAANAAYAEKVPPPPFAGAAENAADVAALKAGVDSGIKGYKAPVQRGGIAQTDIVTFNDGSKAIRKVDNKTNLDAEELGNDVANAVGAGAPAVYRKNDRTLYMKFVNGKVGFHAGQKARDDAKANPVAKRIGMLDQLTFNTDRHGGNWIYDPDNQRPVPIDLGYAFGGDPHDGGPKDKYVNDRVNGLFWPRGQKASDVFTPAELQQIKANLEGLAPKFQAMNRTQWYDAMMARMNNMINGNMRAGGGWDW